MKEEIETGIGKLEASEEKVIFLFRQVPVPCSISYSFFIRLKSKSFKSNSDDRVSGQRPVVILC